jgi:hypothetical protein
MVVDSWVCEAAATVAASACSAVAVVATAG